ncbi:MAG TPA: carboxypeptidase-like regulatory domain-containing protein [Planctomicrobium sp.]|nr:carboxypeptidase-like regulatory domain-containing protein [Planctomicrobium sp.]
MTNSSMAFGIATLLSCGFIAGCTRSAGDNVPLVPVSGTVTLNGQPLPKASIAFNPLQKGDSSYGTTNDQGQYTLMFSGNQPGAIVGEHQVQITTGGEYTDRDGTMKEVKEVLPGKYNSQSTLTADVKPDGGPVDFNLTNK